MIEVILGYSSAPLRGAESSYQPLWAETCRKASWIPSQLLVLLKMSKVFSAGLNCENLWVALDLRTPVKAARHEQLAESWVPGQRPQEAAEGSEMLPSRPARGAAAPHGDRQPGRRPTDARPRAGASLRILHHPAPPGAGISTRWNRPSMHYLQLHQPITLKQLHQHRGCRTALFCIDHNNTRVSTMLLPENPFAISGHPLER